MQISISVPPAFNFKRTAMSHGWRALPHFEFNETSRSWLTSELPPDELKREMKKH